MTILTIKIKVLLTGGTGYIASHTAVALIQAGYDVVLFDNLVNSQIDVVDRIQSITNTVIPFIEGDVRDSSRLKQVLRDYKIDAVIHFAGLKAVGESVEIPVEYYDNNVSGTISLLKAMEATDTKSLVFSSSATVYGEPQYLPLDEAHPTSATNPYGRSKLQVEEILEDVVKTSARWRIAILRYFNPVGAHHSGLIGENPSDIPNNLMPYIAQVASGNLSHLNVFGDDYNTPDGTGVRDYIHVMDLADGHLSALNYLYRQLPEVAQLHTFNLGTGTGYSVLEMISAFEQSSGRTIPYQITSRRAGDIAICYAKAEKAKVELEWTASRTLQEMCDSTWHFQQQLATNV